MHQQEKQSFQNIREEGEQLIESSRISKLSSALKKARDHAADKQHAQMAKDPNFKSCFAIRQRTNNWFYNCFRCMDSDMSFVSVLQQLQRKHPANLSEDYKNILKDKILKLKILQTSRLQLDPNVMHPFVKIHIVDKNTGCYLKTDQKVDEPVIYRRQQIGFYDASQRKFDTCQNQLLLPFATNCCDFRQLGDSRGKWNQKFYINYPADLILSPNTLFLFEILDFNHQALLYKDTDIYDKNNFYRVAWGYLRPIGIGKNHIGNSKIELFRYKFDTKKLDGQLSHSHIPQVYYDFIWNNHQKYDGFLSVNISYTPKPKYKFVNQNEYPKNLFEQEKLDKKYLQKFVQAQDREEENQIKVNQNLLKFYRNKNRCEIPSEIVYKLQSDKLGCFRMKFIGNFLYAACSSRKNTCIKVYSLQNGQKVMTLKGHRQVIYDLSSTQNDQYLISSGSDHITKVWKIPENFGQYIDEQESQAYLRGQCVHTAAVYSSASIIISLQDVMYTLTCCYDGYIRLWQTKLKSKTSRIVKPFPVNNKQRSVQKVYPTCCTAPASGNQFYVGDSIGDIRIFTLQSGNIFLQNRVTHEDLSNDMVLSIQIVERHLIIQSSDNMIRRYQLSGSKLALDKNYPGAQFQSMLSNCKMSPDNKYLLAPSQSGQPFMWDVFTGIQADLSHLNLKVKGALVCCDWHPKYNLIALGGFLQNCPIFVYGNVLSQSEMKIVAVN